MSSTGSAAAVVVDAVVATVTSTSAVVEGAVVEVVDSVVDGAVVVVGAAVVDAVGS